MDDLGQQHLDFTMFELIETVEELTGETFPQLQSVREELAISFTTVPPNAFRDTFRAILAAAHDGEVLTLPERDVPGDLQALASSIVTAGQMISAPYEEEEFFKAALWYTLVSFANVLVALIRQGDYNLAPFENHHIEIVTTEHIARVARVQTDEDLAKLRESAERVVELSVRYRGESMLTFFPSTLKQQAILRGKFNGAALSVQQQKMFSRYLERAWEADKCLMRTDDELNRIVHDAIRAQEDAERVQVRYNEEFTTLLRMLGLDEGVHVSFHYQADIPEINRVVRKHKESTVHVMSGPDDTFVFCVFPGNPEDLERYERISLLLIEREMLE